MPLDYLIFNVKLKLEIMKGGDFMSGQDDCSFATETEEKPEFVSLAAANMADLSCPGCSVVPIEDEEFV